MELAEVAEVDLVINLITSSNRMLEDIITILHQQEIIMNQMTIVRENHSRNFL